MRKRRRTCKAVPDRIDDASEDEGGLDSKRDRDDAQDAGDGSPKRLRQVEAEFQDGGDTFEDDIIMEEVEKFSRKVIWR